MSRSARFWVLAGTLLIAAAVAPLAEAADPRDVLGVAHAAGRYNFSEGDYLNEGADRILELGSRVIKVFLVPEFIQTFYPFNSDWSPMPTDVVDLAQRPYFQTLFAKPFSTFILEVVPVTGGPQFLDGLTKEEADAERDQMYRLTKYLLITYAQTGKTFILQNWEGDHLLRSGLKPNQDPDATRVQGMIDWWNVRQEGVRQARQEVGEHDVEVLHAAEVNFVVDAMEGRVTATSDVLPSTDCDLYSYSSWDASSTSQKLIKALDYLASKAPDNDRFGRRNVYVGEYGVGKDGGVPEGQRYEHIRQLMEAALGWGARYAIYWEVFCNEPLHAYVGRPRNKDLSGFWLIRPDGQKAPLWDMLTTQLKSAFYRGSFSSFANQYIAVSAEGSLSTAPFDRNDPWQTFTIKDWNGGGLEDGDSVSLQAHDGLYLTVVKGPAGRVFARSSAVATPELFTLRKLEGGGRILPGQSITLQSARSGKYLGTAAGGRGAIRALRLDPGATEVFRYVEPQE